MNWKDIPGTDTKKEFKVYTTTVFKESSKSYVHWSKGLTMLIIKDGVEMMLDSDEIEKVVKSLPRTLGDRYK